MLEGLPPNNATHMMRLTIDEARARAVADLVVESFEPAEAASTAFETETRWPGGGKAWQVEVYFGFEPDEEDLRALVAAAADEEAAAAVEFALTEKRDWVANSLAGLRRCGQGGFSCMARTIARGSASAISASRSRRGSRSGPAITGRRGDACCISTVC